MVITPLGPQVAAGWPPSAWHTVGP